MNRNRTGRVHAGAVLLLLGATVLGAMWYSAAVGTPAELSTDLRESLCRLH